MPTIDRINALDNNRFTLWDYGVAAVSAGAPPSHGYIANRWKMIIAGTVAATVSQGTTSAESSIPKWYRAASCMQIAVTSTISGANSMIIRQTIENGQLFGRSDAVLSMVVFGTAGRSFYAGINGNYVKVTTLGNDVPVIVNYPVTLPDLPLATVDVDIFVGASAGTFYIPFAQAAFSRGGKPIEVFEFHQPSETRRRTNRYARRIRQGMLFKAVSATRVVGIDLHPEEMRTAPTLVNPASTVRLTKFVDGAIVDNNAPTISVNNASAQACRIIIDGFTGLTVGEEFMLSSNNIGILHADY